MINLLSTGFKFKPAAVKKHHTENRHNVISRKVYCVCMKNDNNEFVSLVNIPSDLEFPDTLEVPFTKESYNLKGKTDIFSKEPIDNGKYIRLSRNKIHANMFPNLEEIYTPFKEKYVYGGYLVKIDGHYEFNMIDFEDHYINANHLVPNIRLNADNYEEQ